MRQPSRSTTATATATAAATRTSAAAAAEAKAAAERALPLPRACAMSAHERPLLRRGGAQLVGLAQCAGVAEGLRLVREHRPAQVVLVDLPPEREGGGGTPL